MSRKDKAFLPELKEKKWFDKVSFVFKKLFDFNKSVINDAQEEAKEVNLQEPITKAKERIEQEAIHIQTAIANIKEKITDYTLKEREEILKDIKDRISTYKEKALSYKKEVQEKHDISWKIKHMQTEIKKLTTYWK